MQYVFAMSTNRTENFPRFDYKKGQLAISTHYVCGLYFFKYLSMGKHTNAQCPKMTNFYALGKFGLKSGQIGLKWAYLD